MSEAGLEREVVRRLTLRIVPILFLGVFFGYLDRVNVAFAALTMNASLGLSPSAFGWGASVFFLGYLLFEIPGTLCVARFGSRRSMAVFLGAWGVLSSLMSQISSLTEFLPLRFLIGVAEAGFFPGTILYMSYWVPAAHRARLGAYFMLAIPLSMVVGGPVSGLLLAHMDQVAGLHGWQWLFVIEGLPSILLAVIVYAIMDDRPEQAAWLTTPQRDWLVQTLRAEAKAKQVDGDAPGLRNLFHSRLFLLLGVQAGGPAVAYGVIMWLPQVVSEFGMSVVQTGFICALPFGFSAIAMWYWSAHSDRTGERRWHLTLSPLTTAFGLLLSLATASPLLKLLCLLIASLGMFAFLPLAWAASHRLFSDQEAPIGYAVVTMGGAIAGFFSPYLMGILKERTGGYESGILLLVGIGLLAALCAYRLLSPANEHAMARKLSAGSVQ
jgi:ACS family tartrate transporter-like MFS transporter